MSDLPLVTIDGTPRRMGCLPRRFSTPGDGLFRLVGDDELIPEKDWPELCANVGPILEAYAEQTPWNDQGPQGSCCPTMAVHALYALNYEEGEDVPELSQATLYAWDGVDGAGNLIPRRSDSGMSLDFCLYLLRRIGIAPASLIDPYDWQRRNWPDEEDWQAAARENQVLEWLDASKGLRYVMSRHCNGHPVCHGYGGHARLIVRASPKDRIVKCKNSWGRDSGYQWLTFDQVEAGCRQYGAFSPTVSVMR